MDIENNHNQPR